VPIEIIALPPVAFALWLLACAPGGLPHWSVRERAGVATGAGVVLGPLALALFGLFGWLLMLAVVTVALTVFAWGRRSQRLSHRRPGGRLAAHEP